MSIESIKPDMRLYTDDSYLLLVKKINEVISEINDSFQSDLKLRNELVTIKKELKDLTNLVRNR
jgi:hypothetical protein